MEKDEHKRDITRLSAHEQHERAEEAAEKTRLKHRTIGLKLFDVLLYPIVTNLSVFVISVAATYLTSKGGTRLANGTLKYGKIGEWFQKRGDWLTGKFKGIGMSEGQADMAKMVTFSFVDGSLMAPVVKLFEDHREHIGKKIDAALDATPKNDDVYKAEPKQSWLSVLGGRFVTAGIVVPTAVLLDKTGLNHVLFIKPGQKIGSFIANTPSIAKWFGKLDVREIFKVGIFEAFYTSVCTAGLYVSSRFIAKKTSPKPIIIHEHDAPAEPHDTHETKSNDVWVRKVGGTEKTPMEHAFKAESLGDGMAVGA